MNQPLEMNGYQPGDAAQSSLLSTSSPSLGYTADRGSSYRGTFLTTDAKRGVGLAQKFFKPERITCPEHGPLWPKLGLTNRQAKGDLRMRRMIVLAVICFAILAGSLPLRGQAVVNENLEKATLYVDAVNGSDSNSGTQSDPLKTITKALGYANTNNNSGIGTKIIVNPGTYREALSEQFTNNTTSLPITIQAATNGTAIISGADIFTDWAEYSGNSRIYTTAWTENYGFCPADPNSLAPYQAPIVLRREMVYINGTQLTQVLELSQMIYPGTFFVDDPGKTIYVWPYTGTDINSATAEIATRGPEIDFSNYGNFVLRGMVVQYDNTCHNSSAVQFSGNSSNILLDTDTFQWNNSRGLNFQTANTDTPVQNVTVENCQFLHNGQAGGTDFRVVAGLYLNDSFNYNNWRGALGSYYSWASSGMYFEQDHVSTVTNLTALYNQTNGVHWDTDNEGITSTGLVAAGNLQVGVFFEKVQGPITFTGGTVANNLPVPNVTNFVGGGVIFRNSENITLENSEVFGNTNAAVTVEGNPGGIPITNWQTGQNYNLVTSQLTLMHDLFEAPGPDDSVFADGSLGGADWTAFLAPGYSSTSNVWWNSQGNPTPFIVPIPNSGMINFAGWQSLTGQDANSTYQEPNPDPQITYAMPPPDVPDFWLVVDNSTLTAAADGTATFNVYSIPIGSFTGTLGLSLVGVSDTNGLSGTISDTRIDQSGTAQIVLTAAASVPPGTYEGTVLAHKRGLTHAVTFSIVVPTTFVRIIPATLAFPPTQINTSSLPMITTLTNLGTTTLKISNVTTSSQWSQTNTCKGSVAPGLSCVFTMIFTPNAASNITGTMTITDSDPTGSQDVNLTGTGTGAPAVQFDPQFLPFGSVNVGSSSTMTSVLSNTGNGPLNISNQQFGGSDPTDFSETDNCDGLVQSGGSCNINITFKPKGSGFFSATYTITDNAPTGTQTMNMSGTGN
jgi:hypothetical protein